MSNITQDDYTNDTLTTGILSIGGQKSGTLGTSNDVDWFAVDLTAGTTYQFSGTIDQQYYSTYLSLYDASGNGISGTSASGTTGFTPTTSGRYYLSVYSSTAGNYTLSASQTIADDYAASIATTGTLSIGGQASGTLGTSNDVDWFAVDLTAGTTYQFSGTIDQQYYSTYLSLYDASGNGISGTSASGTTGFTPTTSGRYYLSVYSSTAGNYTLSASQTIVDDYAASIATTGTLSIGGQASGTLGTSNDVDWFAVDLTAGTTYQFSGTIDQQYYSTYLSLYDASGNGISGTSASGTTGFTPTTSGRYYLSVYSSTAGNYTLSASQTIVDDYAASIATTGTLSIGGQASGTLGTSNDVDWFAVDLTAGTTYQFSGTIDQQYYSTYLSLYDASGNGISGTSASGTTGFTPTTSGRYYLSVYSSTAGNYTLSASQTIADDYAASIATTGTLSIGGQASGTLGTSNDVDWFAVDLTAGTTYQFSGTIDQQHYSTYLSLYDASGNGISGTSASGTTGLTPTTSGRYYLSVYSSTAGNYTLSASQTVADDYAASIATTGTLSIGGQASGIIESQNDSDWFAIDLTAGAAYQFNASTNGNLSTVVLSLYDAAGSAISGTEAVGSTSFTPTGTGRYYLAVDGQAGDGGYTISSTFSALPTLSITGSSVLEGNSGTITLSFTVSLSEASSQAVSFNFATQGQTATAGVDFQSVSGAYTIGAGSLSTVINVTVNGDSQVERNETLTGIISQANGATLATSTASAIILNDDFKTDDYTADTLTTGKLSAGVQASGIIETLNDSDWFAIDLTAGSTYQFSSTTIDNQSSIQLHLYNANGEQISEAEVAAFTPTNSGRYYLSVDGSKGTGQYSLSAIILTVDDYTSDTSTTGKLPTGGKVSGIIETQNDSDWFAVDLAVDTVYQFNASTNGNLSSVLLGLYDTSGSLIRETQTLGSTSFIPTSAGRYYLAVDGQIGNGGYTISSTSAKLPTLSITDSSIDEGQAGTTILSFTVTLSEASSQAVSFNFATQGLTATEGVDFQALSDTYTIAAGSLSTVIDVTINGDIQVEGNETLTGVISQPSGATLATSAATGTILNDDFQSAFSVDAYRALNADLFYAFGNDDAALVHHYINYGQAEGRATSGFDAEAYAALNPDLFYAFGLNETALTNHYLYAGRAEGRITEGFDAEAYAALNPDLYAVFGTDHAALVNHYIYAGRAEGRVTSGFDAEAYAALNPDLFTAFGLNTDALINHYIQYGRAEGRSAIGFDAETYAALNPDLFNIFGLDHASLIAHYINAGRAEGRQTYQATTPLAMLGLVDDIGSGMDYAA
jgi:hypothetical protein